MNRFFLIVVLIGIFDSVLHAQEKNTVKTDTAKVVAAADSAVAKPDSLIFWKQSVKLNVNLQQVDLTNWAAGGESSVAIGAAIEVHSDYEKDDIVWGNQLNIGYGVIRNGGAGNRFEKTDDLLDITSKYSQKFSEKVLMSVALNFKTQMDEGVRIERVQGTDATRRILISDFMAPGYLQSSLGLSYRNGKKFITTIAPFTGRFTFVLNDSLSNAGAFGIDPGDNVRSEAGISWTGSYNRDIWENVKLRAKFNFFSNYQRFPSTVVNVEAGLNMKVNNFISSNISSQLIFDEDVIVTRSDGTMGTDIQLKNVINVGFTLGF